jgi:peptide/nickel transport system permease protein
MTALDGVTLQPAGRPPARRSVPEAVMQWRPPAVAAAAGRRLAWAIPLLWVVSFLSFALVSLAPGDAAVTIGGLSATPAQLREIRSRLGLDQPMLERYWHWLTGVLHGDLGSSLITGVPVTRYLSTSIEPTLSLVALSLLVAAVLGGALGVASALRGGFVGRVLDVVSLVGLAAPSYWLALVLISMFAARWHLFPAVGYVAIGDSPISWLKSLVLPVCAVSVIGIASIAKQTRDSMMDALNRDFVRVMQANGLSRRSIVYRHALRNAAIPVVTVLGVIAVALLSATVFVETVFGLPGLGSAAATAAAQHDLPVLQGVVCYFTLMVIAINLLVDLSYVALDPRVAHR